MYLQATSIFRHTSTLKLLSNPRENIYWPLMILGWLLGDHMGDKILSRAYEKRGKHTPGLNFLFSDTLFMLFLITHKCKYTDWGWPEHIRNPAHSLKCITLWEDSRGSTKGSLVLMLR